MGTQNEIPALQTEIEKERKKKVQCQHCSELFNAKYVKSHVHKCLLYEKFVRNGLQCSICSKSFESRKDVKQHIGHNHNNIITSANSATQNEIPALQTETGKKVSQNIPNPVPNIPSLLIIQPNTAN